MNNFTSNYAYHSGGGIYWPDVEPQFANNMSFYFFENNTALVYADDIGSFPQKLVFLT